jgi:hypothetical protein
MKDKPLWAKPRPGHNGDRLLAPAQGRGRNDEGNYAGSGTLCWITLSASGPFNSARWSNSAS